MEILVNNRYVINKQVARGSFGIVHMGYDKQTKQLVAIKLEPQSGKKMLEHEWHVYQQIISPSVKIPKVHWFGTEGEYRVMVMDYLGDSLEALFNRCGRRFSLKTTIQIGIQIFDLLHHLHRCNFIHRDLKPENFLIGIHHQRHYVYMIDYGLAKPYKRDRVHMKQVEGKKLVGTARYASLNSHKGIEISRRDDLESLLYLMVYFVRGELPWQGLPGKTREQKYEAIKQSKLATSSRALTQGLPEQLYFFLEHVRSLAFKEKPNYTYLRSLLMEMLNHHHLRMDYKYDWDKR